MTEYLQEIAGWLAFLATCWLVGYGFSDTWRAHIKPFLEGR
jgi:hypothetical protein